MIKNNDKSKPYSHPRWNDKQLPVVIGHIEFSEEEKKKNREKFLDYLRKKDITFNEQLNTSSTLQKCKVLF